MTESAEPTSGATASPPNAAAARPRLTDRVLSIRAVVAVALASVVVGGLGGAVLGAATNDGSDGFHGGPGPGGGPGAVPGGPPGQLPQGGRMPHQQPGRGRTTP